MRAHAHTSIDIFICLRKKPLRNRQLRKENWTENARSMPEWDEERRKRCVEINEKIAFEMRMTIIYQQIKHFEYISASWPLHMKVTLSVSEKQQKKNNNKTTIKQQQPNIKHVSISCGTIILSRLGISQPTAAEVQREMKKKKKKTCTAAQTNKRSHTHQRSADRALDNALPNWPTRENERKKKTSIFITTF